MHILVFGQEAKCVAKGELGDHVKGEELCESARSLQDLEPLLPVSCSPDPISLYPWL